MSGILYLVPSPIGNLQEVSPRVKEVLNLVDFVACEDTRNTSHLLSLLNINKKCVSCHEHNEVSSSQNIVSSILDGKNVAYLSDAGYPCISDPGFILTKKAIENDIKVVPLSGPNAFLNALVGSGIDTSHFLFYGFLDSKASSREKELENLKDFPFTLIFYEAPHRINETLNSMYKILGNRKITIARELTKKFEEFIRSDLKTLVEENREYIGELVVVVEQAKNNLEDKDFKNEVKKLVDSGYSLKDAINIVSILFGANKNKLKRELM
jgi:16S rRNA (cytidine1402-2'-O)-methyltransferase